MVIFIHDSAPSAGSPPPSYTIDVGLEAEQDKPEEHQQPGQTYPSRATDTICSVPEQNNACEQEINPRPQAPQRARVEGIARHTELVHEANMALQPYKAIIVVIAVVVANYFFVGGYKCVYKNETCENRNDNEHGRSNIDDDDHDVRQEQHLRNLAFQMTLFTTGVVVGQVVSFACRANVTRIRGMGQVAGGATKWVWLSGYHFADAMGWFCGAWVFFMLGQWGEVCTAWGI